MGPTKKRQISEVDSANLFQDRIRLFFSVVFCTASANSQKNWGIHNSLDKVNGNMVNHLFWNLFKSMLFYSEFDYDTSNIGQDFDSH